MGTTLGLDVGGTKIHAVRLAATGEVLQEHVEPTCSAPRPDALIQQCAAIVRRLTPAHGQQREPAAPRAVGIGFPGLVDPERGHVHSSVILEGFEDFAFTSHLQAACGIPCTLDNDVTQGARAEMAVRSAEDLRSLLFLTVGTGIGGAVVIDSRIHGGAAGLAGEVGHIVVPGYEVLCTCGRRGCVGAVASGTAIERRAGLEPGSLARADLEDERLASAIEVAAAALGNALASALHLMNFGLVVLGGGVAQLGARFLEPLVETVRREAFDEVVRSCRIEPARAGVAAGAIGAALQARSQWGR